MAITTIIAKLRKSGYSAGFINRAVYWYRALPKAAASGLNDPAQHIIANEYLINHSVIPHEHECSRCCKVIYCRGIECEIPKWTECQRCF